MLREWLAGLVNFDSRLSGATLPDLMIRPARLTSRNFLAGRRTPQLPPLRMFLVVLVLMFLANSMSERITTLRPSEPIFKYVGNRPETGLGKPGVPIDKLTPAQKRELRGTIATVNVGDVAATRWLQQRLNRVLSEPKAFQELFKKWAQRLAILMLPIATAMLALLFIRRRSVMLFDHMIFAMHSLSFHGILFTGAALVNLLPGSVGDWMLLAAPVHLNAHLKGVYPASILPNLARVALLYLGSTIAFVALLAGIMLAGLVRSAVAWFHEPD